MADSVLYDCRGNEIYVGDTTGRDEGVINGVKAVCEKAQRFRYREVTPQDWRRCCICCQHVKGSTDDYESTYFYCTFMRKGINLTQIASNVIGQCGVNKVDAFEGTCDAYIAEEVVVKALDIWRNSKKYREQDVRQAIDVLWENNRGSFRYYP